MQIVGHDAAVEGPAALLVSTGKGLNRVSLAPGEALAYTLGERHCAGSFDGETHTACDRPSAPYCDRHTDRWPCARCTGECSLPVESCREEHAVYLAAFAPATFKVGVTRSWRLDRRLREQGADRGAHLRTVENGRIARQIEADIATEVGDRVRVPAKVRGLHRSVDEDAWQSLLSDHDHLTAFTFDYGLDLADRPVGETMLSGTVHGTKGRVLVVEKGGTAYAVNMHDLVGYDVTAGAPDRDRQSSLGSFG